LYKSSVVIFLYYPYFSTVIIFIERKKYKGFLICVNISCGVQVTDVDITVIELRLPKLV